MALFRVNKNKNYTVMSNYHLRDKTLSLKAKGLLSQMLSLPDDWDYTVNGLCAINKESVSAMQTTLKELEANLYLKRTRIQDGKGRFDYVYDIYENPHTEKPHTENPCTESPCTENRPQLNTKELNTKELNKENNDTNVSLAKAGYGNTDINEMFDLWKDMFGYMPKNSLANRRAVYNMLRGKEKGKEWLINSMKILKEAQKDRFAGKEVNGVANFADLQSNYDKIWKWGSRKAHELNQTRESIEI